MVLLVLLHESDSMTHHLSKSNPITSSEDKVTVEEVQFPATKLNIL